MSMTLKDSNGNPITVDGDMVVLRVLVNSTTKAYKHDGYEKVYPITDEAYESWRKPGIPSYMRDTKFGTDTVEGESLVTVSLKDLRALAFAAARNKSKRAKYGYTRAAFVGKRTWKADTNE